MSVKLHILDSHLEFPPEIRGDYSKQQEGRFHQDIKTVEIRYQGINHDIRCRHKKITSFYGKTQNILLRII